MQSKNSKIQTRPIEDLLGRIRTLRQQGQQQIIIPAKEADQLADSLMQVMTRMVTIQEEIIEALNEFHYMDSILVHLLHKELVGFLLLEHGYVAPAKFDLMVVAGEEIVENTAKTVGVAAARNSGGLAVVAAVSAVDIAKAA